MSTYIIYKDSNTIIAENESTTNIDFTGTDISAILTSISRSMNGGETIYFKGPAAYTPTSAVTFTKSVKLKADRNVTFNWNYGANIFTFAGSVLSTTTLTNDVRIGNEGGYPTSPLLDRAILYHYVDGGAGDVWTDYTTQANNNTPNNFPLLPPIPVVNDAFYFGSKNIFNNIKLNIGTAGIGNGIVWEYYNGTTWIAMPNLTDNTSGFTVSGTNLVIFNIPPDLVGVGVHGSSIDYYIRARVTTANFTRQPLGTQAWYGNVISVTSTGTAVEGDLILIYDDNGWAGNPAYKIGELHEISSIYGNTISITDSTIFNPFLVSRNGSVRFIRPITVEIDGIIINGPDKTGISGNYYGPYLIYTKNSYIHNCTFQNNGYNEFNVDNCYNTVFENNIVGNALKAGLGYGLTITNGSAYTIIINNRFFSCRHAITHGIGNPPGQARETYIINNRFDTGTSSAWIIDSHGSWSWYIYNNVINCPDGGAAIAGSVQITRIIGNTIIGGNGCGQNTGVLGPITFECSNNRFINTRYCFSQGGIPLPTPYNLIIQNNVLIGDVWGIVHIRVATIDTCNISDNRIDANRPIEAAILIEDCNNAIISNNYMNNTTGGISIGKYPSNSSNNNIVSNNIIANWYAGSGNYGIVITNGNHNTISGNILKGTNYGIGVYTTSDSNRIFDNDVSQVTGSIKIYLNTPSTTNTTIKNNQGYKTENSGPSIGIGVQQAVVHGLAITPTRQQIALFSGSATANPYHSADPDARYIYVTAALNQPWYWAKVGT